ncbi:acetyltransferase, gnat family [Bacillus sp. OxB-1]|uniref:GNAT family N-acetyltransferase n=1 Tax=Bacillus sp. (strain OxB-1) TaxID=98228 RepID=UPI000581C70F|nr:GNAT family N-acetyltransferase [Bacillus sp. OxB-1]BAQ11944.1 acetyltransferase, gnat family [Bacillus sp. OxB-1]
MIRKLTEADRRNALQFVSERPAENLFIIGDIEVYGFDNPIQTLWGEFAESGHLRAILLKFIDNYIVYAPGEFDAEGFAKIMNEDRDFKFLSGIESIIRQVALYLNKQPADPRILHYAKCEQADRLQKVPSHIEVKRAVPDDAERIVEQLGGVPEFATSTFDVERNRETLRNGSGRTWYNEKDGQIISSASSTAENSQSAMIVGVGTLPEHQKQGLASYCMSVLCKELLNEGKMLCLFYDNPDAGTIYKRIGFVDIGKWGMWSFN